MKKMIALLLALVLALSLVACGSSAPSSSQAASSELAEEVPTPEPESEPESQPEETKEETPTLPDGETVAVMLSRDFDILMEEGGKTALEMAEAIIANEAIPFGPVAVEVEPGYLPGFTEDITGFEEGATFAPMIGSIPFVGYVFRLADEDTAKSFMENLKEKADPRWNICTEADETVTRQSGSWVYFAMGPTSFE